MKFKIRTAALLLMAMLLSACAMTGRVTDSFCAIGRPIYISKQDVLTDGTARQIFDHNEVGKSLCRW
ncbi:MAG: hypothetical protein DI582_10080 [Azospirillum brasilense]|nr:MAG: hypothetical protein DI582_10080 [Azospirillum brasilense]